MVRRFPKAILLDLDDTILAFSDSADPCWRRVCEKFAPQIEGLTAGDLFSAIEESRSWFWEDPERHRRGRLDLDKARREIVVGAFLRLNINAQDLAIGIADSYTSEREETVQPFPGAIDTLHHLTDQGILLGLITNGNAASQRRKIDQFGLGPYFDVILIEGEFGVGKPDERVYLHVLEQLNVKPEEAWMIGDNLEWDVEAPQRLGIFSIWVDFEGKGLPESSRVCPDRIIQSLTELI